MGSKEKLAAKYVIEATFVIDGVVERHDVIGAIFGQTEGLFPKEFELRELQKSGKIGRIDISLKSEKDKTEGRIVAPSSLDRAETALIAAAMESVDRVGPCEAKIIIRKIFFPLIRHKKPSTEYPEPRTRAPSAECLYTIIAYTI